MQLTRPVGFAAAVVIMVTAMLITSCGGGSSTSAAATQTVVVQNYTFPPITAKPGERISLVDRDAEPHTMTADNGSFRVKAFDSSDPGILVVPTKPGSYAFHCEIHSTMHGTLVVSQP